MSARRPPSEDGATRQNQLPEAGEPDEKSTRLVEDSGVVGELRAALPSPSARDKKTLALYALPDQIVVGRGSASDWQIDDDSLSRKHAQFRWNGRDLTVEDLGSANGTKVNARPVRNQTPVRPGDTVQLGNVIVSFELRGAPAASARPSADEQATRLTTAPPPRAGIDADSDPGARPLAPVATVVRPPPARGAPKPNAAVFRPVEDAANPDDLTARWDANAALVPMPNQALDLGELMRTHRRQLVMGGAAAWIAILLIIWSAFEKRAEEAAPPPPPPTVAKPKVTPLETTPKAPAVDPSVTAPADDEERAAVLAQAIALYDTGKLAESVVAWRRLAAPTGAAGTRDATALFMVALIEGKLKDAPP